MTLRRRTLVIIGMTLIALVALLFLLARVILLDSFLELEAQTVERNLARAQNAIDDDLAALAQSGRDWAFWDDTYFYVQGQYGEYAEANLSDASFTNFRLNLVLFLNRSAEIVYGQAYSYDTPSGEPEVVPLPQGLEAHLNLDDPLLSALFAPDEADRDGKVGILLLGDSPYLIVALPIRMSSAEGPPAGLLLWGRYLGTAEESRLSEVTRLQIDTILVNGALPDDYQAALVSLSREAPVFVQPVSDQLVAGYMLLDDVYGDPALLLRVETPRDIYQRGEATIFYLVLWLVLTGLVFTLVILLLLEKTVLARLMRLTAGVGKVSQSGDLTIRVPVEGQDELAGLGNQINLMLDELRQAHGALQESREQLRRANEVLEQRVRERTSELWEANALLKAEIAGRQRAQEELEVARDRALESLRLKTQILANVSHDARTPLNVLLGYAEMLLDGVYGTLNEQQATLVTRMMSNAEELVSFIGNLLDQAQVEMGKIALNPLGFEPVQLLESLHAFSGKAQAKSLQLTVEIAPEMPPVLAGDLGRLKQILLNLVDNAIKFTDEGAVAVRLYQPDEMRWAIEVRDTGIGIPEEARERIFEAFWQVDGSATRKNNSGVGLGLSIVRELVHLMNGQITVVSETGRGSTFTVMLPFTVTPREEPTDVESIGAHH